MSVLVETTVGDLVIDLQVQLAPTACLNFLKLCKAKYYNYSLFHRLERGFLAQTGKPALDLVGEPEGVSFHGWVRVVCCGLVVSCLPHPLLVQ
jgi:cyclophilin family peptidyl-prolyl cis-trans isomerase